MHFNGLQLGGTLEEFSITKISGVKNAGNNFLKKISALCAVFIELK